MVLTQSTQSSSRRSSSSSDSYQISRRLSKLIELNQGYQFVQQNGQRIFEPCRSNINPPPKGCEIFIGNIPKYMNEDDLIPLFQQAGPIFKFRLMLDFNQRNRGYAFATYFTTHQVKEAIRKFNCHVVGNGAILAVHKSIDNRRLFVGNIPRNKTRDEVLHLFDDYIDGLVDVIMYSSWQDQSQNRGFAFLEFESHSAASVARRQLHPRNMVMWNTYFYVDWADPVPDVDPAVMAQVTVLYVKNVPFQFNNDEVYTLFRNIAGPRLIKKTHKMLNYAFVHCYNRTSAETVKSHLMGLILNDQMLDIEWARPREYSSQFRSMLPPDNYCLSVPLRARKRVRESAKARRAASELESQPSIISTSYSSWSLLS